jgi:hypothetical protein
MIEIEGVQFESAKVIPAGATLVFKARENTTSDECRRLNDLLESRFSGHKVVLLKDCKLEAVIWDKPQPVAHEVPGFHLESGGEVVA